MSVPELQPQFADARITDVLDEYLRARYLYTRPGGYEYLRIHSDMLDLAVGVDHIGMVDENMIQRYIIWRREHHEHAKVPAPQTIQKELGTLLAALRHFKEAHALTFRIPNVPKLKPSKHVVVVPSDAAVDAFIRRALAMQEWGVALAAALAAELCLRRGSIQSITSWHEEQDAGYIDRDYKVVGFLQTKKHEDVWRRLPYGHSKRLRKTIDAVHAARPDRPPTVDGHGVTRVAKAVNTARLNLTGMRHYMVRKAKEAGLNEWEVAAVCGHSNSALVRQVYGRLGDLTAGHALARMASRTEVA